MVITHIACTDELSVLAPSNMFDPFSERNLDNEKLFHRFNAPQAQSRLRPNFTCYTQGSLRVDRQAMDIISVTIEKLLCVRILV
mgnify:CR=1 FL=1